MMRRPPTRSQHAKLIRSPRGTRPRRGFALLIVIVAIALIGSACLGAVRTLALLRRHLDLREQQLQAELLAQHGLDEASRRLARNPEPADDRWDVPLPGRDEELGRLSLRWERSRADGRLRAVVTADVPANSPQRSRVSLAADFPDPLRGDP